MKAEDKIFFECYRPSGFDFNPKDQAYHHLIPFSESGILATFLFSPIAILFVEKPQNSLQISIPLQKLSFNSSFLNFYQIDKNLLGLVFCRNASQGDISSIRCWFLSESPRVQNWKRLSIFCSRKLRTVDDVNCVGKLQKIHICLLQSSTFFGKPYFYTFEMCVEVLRLWLSASIMNWKWVWKSQMGKSFVRGNPARKKLIRAWMKYRKEILKYRNRIYVTI